MENNKPQAEPDKIKFSSLISIIVLYGLGFWTVYKSGLDTNTTWGTIMIIWGWLMILLSVIVSILNIYKIFKPYFKKK